MTSRDRWGIIEAMAVWTLRGTARCLLATACLPACAGPGGDVEPTATSSAQETDTSSTGAPSDDTDTGEDPRGSSGDHSTGEESSSGDDSGSPGGTFGMPAEPMPCPAGVEPSTLHIGHGSGRFTDLWTGPAQLVHGRQGGFHIVLGVRAPGLDTSGPGTAHLRGTVDGDVLADHPFVANLVCVDEAVGAQALWINLVLESTPAELHGKTVEIELQVVDSQGVSVTGSAEVEIADREAAGP